MIALPTGPYAGDREDRVSDQDHTPAPGVLLVRWLAAMPVADRQPILDASLMERSAEDEYDADWVEMAEPIYDEADDEAVSEPTA